MQKIQTIPMTQGPILSRILLFSLPLAATGVLQLLFNAADVIVVGKFAGSNALAAVGSTSSLINLLVGLFIGISIGANIIVARYLGCRQEAGVSNAIHTAMILSVILGAVVLVVGLVFSTPLLRLMGTPDEVLMLSSRYLRIYFLGVPAGVVYNFGAAILRAFGDTRRPLLFLVVSGVINVILNLVLVIVFNLDVAGVAIATVVSQYVSLALVVLCLMHTEGCGRLELKKLRMDWSEAGRMIQIGLPAGLQSVIFNISNVLIQSSVNSFGADVIAANSAAANLAQFAYIAMNSVFHASITFTSQNLGAGKLERVPRIYRDAVISVLLIGVPLCFLIYGFGPQLLSVYISKSDPSYNAVIQYGMVSLAWVCRWYFICGIMEVANGMVRGLGHSWLPMFVTTMGACVLRIVWIYTVFQSNRTLAVLYFSYPLSWVVTAAVHILCYVLIWRQVKSRLAAAKAAKIAQ